MVAILSLTWTYYVILLFFSSMIQRSKKDRKDPKIHFFSIEQSGTFFRLPPIEPSLTSIPNTFLPNKTSRNILWPLQAHVAITKNYLLPLPISAGNRYIVKITTAVQFPYANAPYPLLYTWPDIRIKDLEIRERLWRSCEEPPLRKPTSQRTKDRCQDPGNNKPELTRIKNKANSL